MSLREQVKRAHHRSADVIIGKNGITEGVLGEIRRRLEREGVVKVKFLKTALQVEDMDRREAARLVARLLGARLAGVRGRTFVLVRREARGGQSYNPGAAGARLARVEPFTRGRLRGARLGR